MIFSVRDNGPIMFAEWQRIEAVKLGQTFFDSYTLLVKSDRANRSSPGYSALFKGRPKTEGGNQYWIFRDSRRRGAVPGGHQNALGRKRDPGKGSRILGRAHE